MKLTIAQALEILNISGNINQETIKRAYKRQANKFHPDRNPGDEAATEKMKQVNTAYEFLKAQGDNAESIQNAASAAHDGNMQSVIVSLSELAGITFEIIGRWIWIEGETRTHKEALKALGCKWSRQKAKWYFRPEEYNGRQNRRDHDIDELREKYGTTGAFKAKGFTSIHAQ